MARLGIARPAGGSRGRRDTLHVETEQRGFALHSPNRDVEVVRQPPVGIEWRSVELDVEDICRDSGRKPVAQLPAMLDIRLTGRFSQFQRDGQPNDTGYVFRSAPAAALLTAAV